MKQKLLLVFALCLAGMSWVHAQVNLSGRVTDGESNQPLADVNLMVHGTRMGTVTSENGAFTLSVESLPITLVASMVGYESQEIRVTSADNPIQIRMYPQSNVLNEVVISGLVSTVKRSNLANSVASVSGDELTGVTRPQTTDGALYGKVTGATIRSNSGAPGGGLSIQFRGLSSLVGASQPLIILDGVYINNSFMQTGRATVSGAGGANQDDGANRLADINPDEIENIEILKGPSAAAIYGTRANAGVIIITTKKGKAGRTSVSLSQDVGVSNPLRLLGVDDWNEDKINYFWGGNSAAQTARRELELQRFRDAQASGTFVDYEDFFYNHQRLSSNTRLNISGGGENTRFFVGAGINRDNGLLKNTGFSRYSVRANIDQRIWDIVQLSVNSNFVQSETDRGFTGNQNRTGASVGYGMASVPTYYDLRQRADGSYPDNPYFTENPIAVTDRGINNSLVNRFIQSFNLGVDIFRVNNSFMKFQLSGGLDYIQNTTRIYLPEDLQYQRGQANPGDLLDGKQESINTNLQAALLYNWNLGRVNMNSQVGLVRLDFKNNSAFIRGQGLAPRQINVKQAAVQTILNQNLSEIQEAGIFIQQEANFDDKIIGTLGVRFDRSSLNGDETKFYAFPKASMAINLTRFDELNSDFFSQLKPRIAYGETAGPVSFGSIYTPLNSTNIGGYLGSVVSSSFGNAFIRPETAKELEFGVDIGILNNRFNLEATYYIKNTANNIQTLSLSPSTGVTTIPSNLAELENKGVELSLNGKIIDKTNFTWTSRLMYWKNDVIVSKLDIPSYTTGGFGASLGTFLIKEGERLGTIVGTPEVSPGVFTVWGNSQPEFTASMNNSLRYKNFDLSFLFEWREGGYNINLSRYTTDEGGTTNGWWKDDDNDGVPNGRQRGPAPHNNAGRFVHDASFIKLREAGLYYSMPKAVTERIFGGKVQGFRTGISGTNLLLFTKYEGYDPETSTFGAGLANNVDVAPYPSVRRFLFNLSFDF